VGKAISIANGSRNLKRKCGPLVLALGTMMGLMALAAPSASGGTAVVVSNYSGTGVVGPNAITVAPDGDLWFANYLNDSIGRITTSGVVSNYTGTGFPVLTRSPPAPMAPTPARGGYWMVASDGGIFSFGDAQFYGSTGNIKLNAPIVGMAVDSSTGGYWFVGSDGGVFSEGTPFYGAD
jgi:streptogramin lyase